MDGVRLRDVSFSSIQLANLPIPIKRMALEHFSVGVQNAELQLLASLPSYIITCNVTAALSRLGYTDSAAAYKSLANQLESARSSGSYVAMLGQYHPSLIGLTVAEIVLTPIKTSILVSPTAAPTVSPTTVIVVPKVFGISIMNVSRSTVSINVTLTKSIFSKGDIAVGYVFCAIMPTEFTPSSIGSIKSADSIGTFRGSSAPILVGAKFPLSLQLQFTGLQAAEVHSVYCYAETSVGQGNSLAEVLDTEATVETKCCKVISFLNLPSAVYLDSNRYIGASPSLFVFQYALPGPLKTSFLVKPLVYLNRALMSDVTATPVSVLFSPSSPLTGRFYLSSKQSYEGKYSLVLDIIAVNNTAPAQTAPSSSPAFAPSTWPIRLLSPLSLVPAPDIVSAIFSESGQAVIISFDSPTDMGGITSANWTCSALFTFNAASKSTCEWLGATAVRTTFWRQTGFGPQEPFLEVGDTVTLLPNRLRAFCTSSAATCTLNPSSLNAFTRLKGPLSPLRPVALIIAPSKLGSCSNLSLDATESYGNGGRLYRAVSWSVTANLYSNNAIERELNTTALEKYLNEYSREFQVTRPIPVVSTYFARGTYTFILTLTNFFGATGSQSFNLDITTASKAVSVTIIGPAYLATYAYSNLTILAAGSISSCAKKDAAMTYRWSVQEGSLRTSLTSTSADPLRFSLPAYSLIPDKTYTFTVTAREGKMSSSASVTVYVSHGPVSAIIAGGASRTNPVDSPLLLDASLSSDADRAPGLKSNLTYKVRLLHIPYVCKSQYSTIAPSISRFHLPNASRCLFVLVALSRLFIYPGIQWSCTIGSLVNFAGDCGIIGSSGVTTSLLKISSNSLSLGTIYVFVVEVSARSLSDSKTVTVTPVPANSAEVTISSTSTVFNPKSKLILTGYISSISAVSAVWGVFDTMAVAVPFTSLTPVTKIFKESSGVTATQIIFPISLSADSFSAGQLYTFRLSASSIGSAVQSFADITLVANSAPTGGRLVTSPSSGVALQTLFLLSSPGWAADSSVYPLSYFFAYRCSSYSVYKTVAAMSLRAFAYSHLPSGSISTDESISNKVQVQVEVQDTLFSFNVATTYVSVTQGAVNVSSYVQQNLKDAFFEGNIDLAFQTINNVRT